MLRDMVPIVPITSGVQGEIAILVQTLGGSPDVGAISRLNAGSCNAADGYAIGRLYYRTYRPLVGTWSRPNA